MGVPRVLWWLLFAVLASCSANPITWNEFEVDGAVTALQLDRYEYEDKCNTAAAAEWTWLLGGAPVSGPLAERKRQAEEEFAGQKRSASNYVHEEWQADGFIPPQLAEGMDMEAHPGDELLGYQLYNQKLDYLDSVASLYDSTRIPCFRNSASCQMNVHDVRTVLAQSGDLAELLHTWRHWHSAVKTGAEGYVHQVKLLREAASINEAENPTSYWHHLQEFDAISSSELSYQRAEELWEEIEPLYTKLQKYVARWLRHQLGDFGTSTKNIPAHILGSLVGEDWSDLADLVMPPDDSTLKDFQKALATQRLVGQRLYDESFKMLTEMGLEELPEHIWKDVNTTGTCPPKTVRFCDDEGTLRVLTCREASWKEYLNAHEIMARAALSHLAVQHNEHILRQKNRYSALVDAIPGMVSLLAVSPARLSQLKLVSKDESTSDVEDYDYDTYAETRPNQAILLLLALRTLPRLPYYLAADKWRLEMLANNATNTTSWSKFRKQYQMIEVPDGDNSDISFLSDPYLLSNRPYLTKFLGTILQFQMLEYFVDISHENPLEAVKEKDELGILMTKSQSMKWPDVVQEVLNMNSLSAEALLNYFKPLEKLLERSVKKGDPKVTRRVVDITTPRPTVALNRSADLVEQEPQDQPPSTAPPVISTESLLVGHEDTVDVNNTLAGIHLNATETESDIQKGSTGVSTAILIASLVVFALAVTAGVLVAARRCYKRKYQRNRRPPTE